MRWGGSYHNTWFYMESAKTRHEQIPYIHLQQLQSREHQHGAPQPTCGSIPQPRSAAQRQPLSLGL